MDEEHNLNNSDELTEQNVETIAEMERLSQRERTRGERLADAFAKIIGSWTFLVIQTVVLAAWIILNITAWINHWDPYPFILMNLALSFQAAFAGPIILMSQNRQTRISDRRNHLDLQINLLSEQENTELLRLLHKICKKLEIPMEDSVIEILEQKTKPGSIIREIEKRIERQKRRFRKDRI